MRLGQEEKLFEQLAQLEWDSPRGHGRGCVMRTLESVPLIKRNQMARVLRYLLDSVLACAGSLLVTGVIVVFHLYPFIPNITIIYLPVVLALAVVRGRNAAILSAVVAFLSLTYFVVPPLYTLNVLLDEEWIALFNLLIVAVLTGHLAAALREREKQANHQAKQDAQNRVNELTAIFEAITDGVSICDARGYPLHQPCLSFSAGAGGGRRSFPAPARQPLRVDGHP